MKLKKDMDTQKETFGESIAWYCVVLSLTHADKEMTDLQEEVARLSRSLAERTDEVGVVLIRLDSELHFLEYVLLLLCFIYCGYVCIGLL